MGGFFTKIIYSAANEDPQSELQSLAIKPEDTVFCITGSGARALDLLTANPQKLISLDFNPTQNYLLELKCAAYKELDYQSFISFIGIDSCEDRLNIYQKLKTHLSNGARLFWDKEPKKIRKGILYCGVWENYLQKLAIITQVRSRSINQLMQAQNLEEQIDAWENSWKNWAWNNFLQLIGQRWVWKYVLKEPGIDYIPIEFNMSEYIQSRLDHIISTQLIKTNPFLNLMIRGKYSMNSLPLHLQEKSFLTIKANLSRLAIVTEALDVYLCKHPNTIDAFSISDFSSYVDHTRYKEIWSSLLTAAKNKARVCERYFMVEYQPEKFLKEKITRNNSLEQKLQDKDHSFIYRFNCCHINN